MADRFWVDDDVTGLWNSANNWSATNGGAGGAGVPGAGDTANFSALGQHNCTINAAVSCASIVNYAGGYVGQLDGGVQNVTLSGNLYWVAGTILGGTGTWKIAGDVTLTGGTFTAQTSTVEFNGSGTIDMGGNSLKNFALGEALTGGTIVLGSDLTLTGTFTIGAGASTSIDTNVYKLTIPSATVDLTNLDTLDNFDGLIVLNGTAAQTLTTTSIPMGNVTITNTHAGGVIFADHGSFRNFVCSSACSKLTFNAGSNYVFQTLTLSGDSAAYLTIISSLAGTAFNCTLISDSSCQYVSFKDCDASGGHYISAFSEKNTDVSGNTNIVFDSGLRQKGMTASVKSHLTVTMNRQG